jgi:hypothetical protein
LPRDDFMIANKARIGPCRVHNDCHPVSDYSQDQEMR